MIPPLNREIADRFKEVAELLHDQGSHPFRAQAYRHAAQTLEQLERPVDDILHAEGVDGLQKLPGIGESLSRAIREMILTGKLPILVRLRGEAEPVSLFASVPGIGKKLADRLHHDLEIDTLEELEIAAHDGRLLRQPRIWRQAALRDHCQFGGSTGSDQGKAWNGGKDYSFYRGAPSMLTESIVKRPLPTNFINLRPVALIQLGRPGFLCYTPNAASAITRLYSRILLERTKRGKRKIGWCCSMTMVAENHNVR